MSRTMPVYFDTLRPYLTAALALSMILAAGVIPLAAQDAAPEAEERALALKAQAEGYLEAPNRVERAADLYRRAAELRSDADPRKVENLQMAARLSFYAGKGEKALADQAAAAMLATRQGDVIRAGHAWLDAAWVAVEIGKAERAEEYTAEARLLTTSPLLAESDRSAIHARIVS